MEIEESLRIQRQLTVDAIRGREAVMLEIAAIDPGYPSEGSVHCFFCGAFLEANEPHADGCLWARAKAVAAKLANMLEVLCK